MQYIIAIVCIIIVAIVGFYKWLIRKGRLYWEKRGVPFANNSIVNSFYEIYKKPVHEILLNVHKKYGRISGSFEFRKPILTVSDPELLRDILVKDFPIFNYRRDFKTGDGIADKLVSVMKGEDWKRVRTLITPAFTSKRMRQMTHIINEVSNTVVKVLEKHADEEKPADFRSIFGAFTLDVIAKAAFATKIDSLNDPENIFAKEVKKVGTAPQILRFLILLILPTWLLKRLKFGFLPSTDFFKSAVLQVIKDRKETGKINGSISSHVAFAMKTVSDSSAIPKSEDNTHFQFSQPKYDDMLQLLLDATEELENEKSKETINVDDQEDETDQFGSVTNSEMSQRIKYKKMSEDELIAQCILFLLVGYGTTASTLSFMAYSLALNPECQQKLNAEIDEVFEKRKELNYDAVRDMKYLDCVISETLRMYPALIRSERTACEDYKLGNTGITIEKGTIVGFNIHAMHHDPEFFPNPEKFYPERFLSENANHPQYAYLPFGAGPRNCLGMRFALMEIKLCMSHILRHYTLKISETTKVPLEMTRFTGFMEVNELPLTVERRSI